MEKRKPYMKLGVWTCIAAAAVMLFVESSVVFGAVGAGVDNRSKTKKAANTEITKTTKKSGEKKAVGVNSAAAKSAVKGKDTAKGGAGKAFAKKAVNLKFLTSAAIGKKFLLDKPVREFSAADKRRVRLELEALLRRRATQQFLSVIQIAEGGEPNIMVGDKPGCRVRTLRRHPGEVLPSRCFFFFRDKGRLKFSTAAGNYQITRQNYRMLSPFLDLKDFEVLSQQLAAVEIVRRGTRKPALGRKGFEALVRGDVKTAIKLGTSDWASMPGSDLPGYKRKDVGNLVKIKTGQYVGGDSRARFAAKRQK
jgi:muramidase (phage lysozyme)